VTKTLEAQVDQFLLGCNYPVNRLLPGRAKDLSARLHILPKRLVILLVINDEAVVNALRRTLFRGIVASDTLTHSVLTSRVTPNAFLFCALANDCAPNPGVRAG
jgi:hypothetical protein